MRGRDFIDALGMPDEGFSSAVDAALRQATEREARPIMKKKMTMALLAAVVAAIALAGAALALGFNLFNYFGAHDPQLQAIAPEAGLEVAADVAVTTEALGATRARIDSAYYDGERLIVACAVDNFRGCDRYAPTDEELAQMTVDADFDPGYWAAVSGQSEAAEAFRAALAQKRPFGIVQYEIAVGAPCATDDGVELICASEDVEGVEGGELRSLFEFETPLPEAARNRDRLSLVLPLDLYTTWRWFDGERVYERSARQPLTALTATVARANAAGSEG